jgi:hypothetical protein
MKQVKWSNWIIGVSITFISIVAFVVFFINDFADKTVNKGTSTIIIQYFPKDLKAFIRKYDSLQKGKEKSLNSSEIELINDTASFSRNNYFARILYFEKENKAYVLLFYYWRDIRIETIARFDGALWKYDAIDMTDRRDEIVAQVKDSLKEIENLRN